VDVIRPKLALLACTFGALNVGWFRTLKNSNRNCRYALSFRSIFLRIDGSHSFSPSLLTFVNVVENVRT
jgi:hypothetical protein